MNNLNDQLLPQEKPANFPTKKAVSLSLSMEGIHEKMTVIFEDGSIWQRIDRSTHGNTIIIWEKCYEPFDISEEMLLAKIISEQLTCLHKLEGNKIIVEGSLEKIRDVFHREILKLIPDGFCAGALEKLHEGKNIFFIQKTK